jgi:hypothetical protein
VEGEKIQAGQGHENGDVEQRHHRLKRALAQELMLRGSKDFVSVEEYQEFVKGLLARYERSTSTKTSMRWPRLPAIESSKDTKRTQSVEWGSSRSCQVIEKTVSAVGIEPTTY